MRNKWGLADPDLLKCFEETIRENYGNLSNKQMEEVMDKVMKYNEHTRFILAGLSESDWQENPD